MPVEIRRLTGIVVHWLQKCTLADSPVSWNGKPVLPVMPSQNWNSKAGSKALRDTVLPEMRSDNRLKIFSGTANEPLSQVRAQLLTLLEFF